MSPTMPYEGKGNHITNDNTPLKGLSSYAGRPHANAKRVLPLERVTRAPSVIPEAHKIHAASPKVNTRHPKPSSIPSLSRDPTSATVPVRAAASVPHGTVPTWCSLTFTVHSMPYFTASFLNILDLVLYQDDFYGIYSTASRVNFCRALSNAPPVTQRVSQASPLRSTLFGIVMAVLHADLY